MHACGDATAWKSHFSCHAQNLEVEDIGIVTGGLNSQLDWNLDLNTSLGPAKLAAGVSPVAIVVRLEGNFRKCCPHLYCSSFHAALPASVCHSMGHMRLAICLRTYPPANDSA